MTGFAALEDDGSCGDCTAKRSPGDFDACPNCGAECGHGYCAPCVGLIPEHVTEYATTCPTCDAAADRPCDHFPVQMLAGARRFVLPTPEHVTATAEQRTTNPAMPGYGHYPRCPAPWGKPCVCGSEHVTPKEGHE